MGEDPQDRLDAVQLRTLFLFEALDDAQLARLSEAGRVKRFGAGTVVAAEGDPAECFFVLLEGTIAISRRVQGSEVEVNRTSHRGVYAGATQAWLTTDQAQAYSGSVHAVTDCTMFVLPAADLGAAMRDWFPMAVHLLEGLFSGLRNSQALVGQRERLLALGRLTAGLTHELNNPAAAAVRATATLRERVAAMRQKLAGLAGGKVDADTLVRLTRVQEDAIERAAKAESLSPLETSDAEDELSDWLDERGVHDGWQLAPVLVAAGLDVEWLDSVAAAVPPEHLGPGLKWVGYALETEQLMTEIEDSTQRISALVGAAKQYSQMDRAEFQVIDVHEGLKSTLVMLGRKLGGVQLVKEFDRSLPRIPGYPGELNQVWTNILDNALGAMKGEGTLTVRTADDGECVLVEIGDTGPGIPAEILPRIFEPFFTTKPVGEGTGLGLDISFRIVTQRHGGDLRVVSEPGDTRFQVRLPKAGVRSQA